MTEKIEALLVRLKELDPETWARLRLDERGAGIGCIAMPFEWENCVIQCAVQEAIVARGWDWEIYQYSPCGMSEAAIFIAEDRSIEECGGDGPAEALLRAYIAALEAQRGAGE